MGTWREKRVWRLAWGVALACCGCATPDMGTLADAPASQLPKPGLLAAHSPPPPVPLAPAGPAGAPIGHATPASFVSSGPPPMLPPEAYPPRFDYLQQGPTFAPRSLPPVHPTATERMLEMQAAMEQLLADGRELKQRVATIEGELATNQTQLTNSRQEVETLRDDLQATQQQMRASYESFERLAQQLESNEEAHLRQLDEIIATVRSTVRAQLMQAAASAGKEERAEP